MVTTAVLCSSVFAPWFSVPLTEWTILLLHFVPIIKKSNVWKLSDKLDVKVDVAPHVSRNGTVIKVTSVILVS